MKGVFKTAFFIFLFNIGFLFFFSSKALAFSNFTTDYKVIYTVGADGITHANLTIVLTNTTSQYYASSYKVRIGFNKIMNITATDPNGKITPVVQKTDDGYTLTFSFNKKAIGSGVKLPFTITFDTPSIAQKNGRIWEINIPGIANPNDFSAFSVDVRTPASFDQPVYVKPNHKSSLLTFTKDEIGKAGISIAFGEKQYYSFHLLYHLKNDNLFPVKTQIALPPTTNYQYVFLTNIQPKPESVSEDKDGNWLAQYSLLPSQKKDITVDGKVSVNLKPSTESISQEDITEYISDKPYWFANEPEIKALARDLKTPNAIYQYVIKTLHYDFSRVTNNQPRLGAVNALKNQNSAVCREFTDLFIALSRAAGIPAREIDGFAYTENTKQRPLSLVRDILHSWPEYYDTEKKTWVMVDPTWGSTTGGIDYFNTLDFDHFAFAIKGRDSSYPIPAGGYKVVDDTSFKDINVTFTDTIPEPVNDVSFATNISSAIIAGLPVTGKLTVINNGPNLISTQDITLHSDLFTPHDQSIRISEIPPYGTVMVPMGFYATPFLTNRESQFTIHLGDKTSSQHIKIVPIYLTKVGIGGLIIGILAIILFIITIQIRRIRFFR